MSGGMNTFRLLSGEPVSRLGQGAWQIGENKRKRAGEHDALRIGLELGLTSSTRRRCTATAAPRS